MSRSVRVTVAGVDLAVRTDAKPRYLRELAGYVGEKMEQAGAGGKVVATQKVALLAALGMADELFLLRAKHARLVREVRERGKRILRELDAESGP